MAQLKLIKNSSGAGKEGTGKAGSRSSKATLDYVYGLAGDRPVAVCSINMIGGTAEAAEAAFEATRAAWSKRTKNEVYHWEQSFRQDELDAANPDHWVRANEIGGETARRLWPTRPVEIVTHIGDDGLIHNHYVVGNVDTLTGRAARGQEMAWFRAFPIHEQVLKDMGHVQPDIMPKTVDEARARSIEKRENQRDDFAQKWARIWDPQGLTSWSVAEDRAKVEDFELVIATASRDGRGGVKKGDRVLRFRTSVNKRMQTYNGQRYGVDLAEAEQRVAQGAALAKQTLAPTPPPPPAAVQARSHDQNAGLSSGLLDALDAVRKGKPIPPPVTPSTEPSVTQSPTEPQAPAPATEPPAAQVSAEDYEPVVSTSVAATDDELEIALDTGDLELVTPDAEGSSEANRRLVPPLVKVPRARETLAQRIHRETQERAETDTPEEEFLRKNKIDPDSVATAPDDKPKTVNPDKP